MIYSSASQWTTTIGSGGIANDTVTTIPLSSTLGLTDGAYYIITVDRVDANGEKTPSKREVIAGQLSGSNLINCTRGVEGTAQAHSAGAVVEMLFTSAHWSGLKTTFEDEHNTDGTHKDTLVTTLKATGSDINTGTNDAKIVTPKAIADSNVVITDKSQTLTNKILTSPVIDNIISNTNFTLTQNSVIPFTSVKEGAVANTLYLKEGRVGIKVTNPVAALELEDGQWIMLSSHNNNIAGINFYEGGTKTATNIQYGGKIFYDEVEDTLKIITRENNVDKLGIVITRANGNVGVGTTTPGYKLDVAGQAHATSFPTSSDIRLKKNIVPLATSGSVLDKLENLQGVYFDWNDIYKKLKRATEGRQIGLIAQDVEKQFPELVSTWGDGSDYRGVEYGRLTAVLLEGIKELNQKVKKLETTLKRLKNYVKRKKIKKKRLSNLS